MVKRDLAARLTRERGNMAVLKPALDKLTQEELIALNRVLMHMETERANARRRARTGILR